MGGRPLMESLPFPPLGLKAMPLPGVARDGSCGGIMDPGRTASPWDSWSCPRARLASCAISPPFKGANVLGALREGGSAPVGGASGGKP